MYPVRFDHVGYHGYNGTTVRCQVADTVAAFFTAPEGIGVVDAAICIRPEVVGAVERLSADGIDDDSNDAPGINRTDCFSAAKAAEDVVRGSGEEPIGPVRVKEKGLAAGFRGPTVDTVGAVVCEIEKTVGSPCRTLGPDKPPAIFSIAAPSAMSGSAKSPEADMNAVIRIVNEMYVMRLNMP